MATTLNWQAKPTADEIEAWVDVQWKQGNKQSTNFRQIEAMETAIIMYHRAIRQGAKLSQRFVDMVVNGDDQSVLAFIAGLSKE